MGLFITRDGRYKGWLAGFLCCCAALNDDEYPVEKHRSNDQVCSNIAGPNRQPSLQNAPPRYSVQREPSPISLAEDQDASLPAYSHSDTFELAGVAIPRPARHRRLSSFGLNKRSSISAPSAFRRVEHTESQRRSLIPLHLGPVVLKDQPDEGCQGPPREHVLEAHVRHTRSDSTQGLLHPYEAGTPHQRSPSASSFQRPRQAARRVAPDQRASAHDIYPSRRSLSTRSSSNSLHQQSDDGQKAPSRASSDPSRPKKRALRKRTDRGIEQEVLELNTIVEEKRAEAARSRAADDHVPAIAPSMQVQARSETLEGIGSALSRPFTPRHPLRINTALRQARHYDTSGSPPVGASTAAWPSGTPRSPTLSFRQQFGKGSVNDFQRSSAGSPQPPSLTDASSPTSKTHSRAWTAESRSAPLSPLSPTGVYELDADQDNGCEAWPVRDGSGPQVGLAF